MVENRNGQDEMECESEQVKSERYKLDRFLCVISHTVFVSEFRFRGMESSEDSKVVSRWVKKSAGDDHKTARVIAGDMVVDERTLCRFEVVNEEGKGRGLVYRDRYNPITCQYDRLPIEKGAPVVYFNGVLTRWHLNPETDAEREETDVYTTLHTGEDVWQVGYLVMVGAAACLVPIGDSPEDVSDLGYLVNAGNKNVSNVQVANGHETVLGARIRTAFYRALKPIPPDTLLTGYYGPGAMTRIQKRSVKESDGSKKAKRSKK